MKRLKQLNIENQGKKRKFTLDQEVEMQLEHQIHITLKAALSMAMGITLKDMKIKFSAGALIKKARLI